jgi:hypothetical protein
MIGHPLPSYPLNPWDPQAAAFLATMMTRVGATARPAEPPATGWLQAYRVTRCGGCGTGVLAGSRCRQCAVPR